VRRTVRRAVPLAREVDAHDLRVRVEDLGVFFDQRLHHGGIPGGTFANLTSCDGQVSRVFIRASCLLPLGSMLQERSGEAGHG